MGVKMNFRIITKNHEANSKIGSPKKSILEPLRLAIPPDSLGRKITLNSALWLRHTLSGVYSSLDLLNI